MNKAIDITLVPGLERLFQQLKLDDLAFLGFIILLGACYTSRGIVWAKPDPYHHLWFEKPQAGDEDQKAKTTRDIALKLEQSVRLKPAHS